MKTKNHSAQSVLLASKAAEHALAELTDAGNRLCDEGKIREALDCFLKALEIVGHSKAAGGKRLAICHYNAARAYAGLDMNGQALEHYEKALQAMPRLVQAHNNIGMVLNQLARFDEAIEHFKKAIQHDPLFAPAYYGLGVALQSTGDDFNAAFAYQKALTFNPDSYPSWVNLGLICYTIKNYEVAVNCYTEAIAISAHDPEVFYDLGLAHLAQGQLKEASAAFGHALELKPDHEAAQDALRETMYFTLEKPEALK